MTQTNTGLVAYCKAQLGKPYWYGTFGQISSEALYNAKKKQYPKYYDLSKYKQGWSHQYNQRVHDCVGLIKGYLWSTSSTATPKYNANQDVSANGMLSVCKTKGKIATMPDIPGVLVFMPAHVGVYIGGGYVIEARGHDYGVVKTKLVDRPWVNWGKCPYIEYAAAAKQTSTPTKKPAPKYYPKCSPSYRSIVDALNSIKVDSSKANRKKIAAANGIKNYLYLYSQNVKLLALLKAGKLIRP